MIRLPAWWSRLALPIAGIGTAAGVFVLLQWTGATATTRDALIIMGFDPDRAQLITALVAGAIGAASAMLVADRSLIATLAGASIVAVLFARTFLDETQAALASTGADGTFDPVGWSLTVATLLVIGLAVTWAAAAVAGNVRAALADSIAVVSRTTGRRSVDRSAWRPAAALVAVVALAVTVPVFGDMVNYSPDAHMRVGAPPPVGLVDGLGQVSQGGPGGGAGGLTVDGSGQAAPGAGPTPNASGVLPPIVNRPRPASSTARPWLSWRPTGVGRLIRDIHVPAPWTGGSDSFATLTVYLPPGYDQSPRRSYPVVYEVPWTYDLWDRSLQLTGMLDSLIDGGQIPPLIVAFVAHNGAPIPDSECIDSKDGRQQLETYMTGTVVNYMDMTFRTIAAPSARALFGFSQGGFCAPMLLLRHPDVFNQAIAMSGYFQAALRSGQTVNAARPFGGDQQLIADHSPIDIAPTLPSNVRDQLFLVLSSDPTEPIYGPQYQSFAAVLKSSGYHDLLLPTRLGHAWSAVRATLPTALEAVAAEWVAAGDLTS